MAKIVRVDVDLTLVASASVLCAAVAHWPRAAPGNTLQEKKKKKKKKEEEQKRNDVDRDDKDQDVKAPGVETMLETVRSLAPVHAGRVPIRDVLMHFYGLSQRAAATRMWTRFQQEHPWVGALTTFPGDDATAALLDAETALLVLCTTRLAGNHRPPEAARQWRQALEATGWLAKRLVHDQQRATAASSGSGSSSSSSASSSRRLKVVRQVVSDEEEEDDSESCDDVVPEEFVASKRIRLSSAPRAH